MVEIREEKGFRYVEQGKGPALLLLHGLFGALSNFHFILDEFSDRYQVIIPLMPVYDKSQVEPSVEGLTDFVCDFMDMKGLEKVSFLGNSLGGHIALMVALQRPAQIETLTLTGSSGLFETGMGSSFPKRGSFEYIRERVIYTFYNPASATPELIDEVYRIVNDNYAALRILRFARSAQNQNLREEIGVIRCPVMLIWGLNDNITPAHVAHEFHRLLPQSELNFIDCCAHAPMMEQPRRFNQLFGAFLDKYFYPAA